MKRFLLLILIWILTKQGFTQDTLIYHIIQTDKQGHILPWFNQNPAIAYDHVLHLIWNFWDTMRMDMNGIPYYMNHQVWQKDQNDPRGLGGDQLQMALSSWFLYYAYTGNERIKENMRFMADYYLTHGFSPPDCEWSNLPFPYNTLIYSGKYDGDMVIGKGFLQPDKAGSLGLELIKLYKMMSREWYPNKSEQQYLEASIEIANTLANKIKEGDENNSPLPFKVHAFTGKTGTLKEKGEIKLSSYTTNWSGTLELFENLIRLNTENSKNYQKAFDILLSWMKKYPMKNNKWGPFFEDISGWSDTQINAMTWARFIMNHQPLFPDWKEEVQNIMDWVYKELGNDQWKKYGVTVINEQTAYRVPGNSHTSRQAADELLFWNLTGNKNIEGAIRKLNWATYMVDDDGKNRYPRDQNWLTDGYGDYVRHYLRAMASTPQLAPNENHILSSTSIIQSANYHFPPNPSQIAGQDKLPQRGILYQVYDKRGEEIIRMKHKPQRIFLDNKTIPEKKSGEGYVWSPLEEGGVLIIRREQGTKVEIF